MSQITVCAYLIGTREEILEALSAYEIETYGNTITVYGAHEYNGYSNDLEISFKQNQQRWIVEYSFESYAENRIWDDQQFHWLNDLIRGVKEEREKERRRQEQEEERRRLEEERLLKQAINVSRDALDTARQRLQSKDFEGALVLLRNHHADFQKANLIPDYDSLQEEIIASIEIFLREQCASIKTDIEAKNWELARSKLQSLDKGRIEEARFTTNVEELYEQLSTAHEQWKKEEEERKRKAAIRLAKTYAINWLPQFELSLINTNTGMGPFVQDLLEDHTSELMKNEPTWKTDTELIKQVQERWRIQSKHYVEDSIHHLVTQLSRSNSLTDDVLLEGHPTENQEFFESKLIELVCKLDGNLEGAIKKTNAVPSESAVSLFKSKFLNAEYEYQEEMKKTNNRVNSKKLIGAYLGIEGCETDVITQINERYINSKSTVSVFYNGDHVGNNEDIIRLVLAGEDIRIQFDQYYESTDVKDGHLAVREEDNQELHEN